MEPRVQNVNGAFCHFISFSNEGHTAMLGFHESIFPKDIDNNICRLDLLDAPFPFTEIEKELILNKVSSSTISKYFFNEGRL